MKALLIIVLITFICPSPLAYGCIPNKPPIAAFTYSPPKPRVCESIIFNASASYDPDGSIASYTWDFDDENITKVFDAIVNHHYEMLGTYNVTLTVADSGGLKNSTSKEITITKPPFRRLYLFTNPPAIR